MFVGDLVDRGPDTPGVLRLAMGMVDAGHALCVTGNHENKLVRALDGRKVKVAHGLAESLAQLDAEDEDFRKRVRAFCDGLISHYVLDGGKLVVAHAGLKEEYHGRASGRVRSFAMYGETTGETDEFGLPVRYPWANDYRGPAMVLYGHTPVLNLEWVNNTLCLDTGAVFGGRLSALRYPEREPVSVPAEQVWYEPVRPLAATTFASASGVVRRDPGVLDLDDVLGRRTVEARHLGRVTVQEENAAAALEVMSRFAVDPRWLVYLPPTMAPCATSTLPGFLEHPAEAFAAYRDEGVRELLCEEKHMGSRAVVVLARDARGRAGPLRRRRRQHRRRLHPHRPARSSTGRSMVEAVLARVRAAVDAAGLWSELETDWLLLDCELLPWSAKAMGLLRDQYAAVGAAARASLTAATSVLAAARRADWTSADLAARQERRLTRRARLHRRLRPLLLAGRRAGRAAAGAVPDPGLAGRRTTPSTKGNDWHIALADRLVAADPEFFTRTERRVVDLDDEASVAEATAWWQAMTAAGGEGMVVKPLHGFTTGPARPGAARREVPRPGVPADHLRPRIPGAGEPGPAAPPRPGPQAVAGRREYALGLESLERFVGGEPLWRVHEAVFAVLALESEPVDPRL